METDKQLKGALIMIGVLLFLLFFMVGLNYSLTTNYNECVEKFNILSKNQTKQPQWGRVTPLTPEEWLRLPGGTEWNT